MALAQASPNPADLAKSRGCLACHGADKKIVGPAFKDVAAKYKGDASAAAARLAEKIRRREHGKLGIHSDAARIPPYPKPKRPRWREWVLGL